MIQKTKLNAAKFEQQIIKKYPNRRLYDTKFSQYITLEDLRQLVKNEKTFQVLEAKTGNDLTRSTLLQIILHQEVQNHTLLTTDLLQTIIGFYDDPMRALLSRYLEHSISVFREHQADLKSPLNSLLTSETQIHLLHDLAEQSLTEWQSLQK